MLFYNVENTKMFVNHIVYGCGEPSQNIEFK